MYISHQQCVHLNIRISSRNALPVTVGRDLCIVELRVEMVIKLIKDVTVCEELFCSLVSA